MSPGSQVGEESERSTLSWNRQAQHTKSDSFNIYWQVLEVHAQTFLCSPTPEYRRPAKKRAILILVGWKIANIMSVPKIIDKKVMAKLQFEITAFQWARPFASFLAPSTDKAWNGTQLFIQSDWPISLRRPLGGPNKINVDWNLKVSEKVESSCCVLSMMLVQNNRA